MLHPVQRFPWYTAYKSNKQGDSIQPWCTPFPIWKQSVVACPVLNCCFLTFIQISQEIGRVVWYAHLFENFPFVVIHTVKLWKILKEMGIPDHLTCLLRNLYAVQEATVKTGHGTTDWFQMGKESIKAVYCHPAYLTYMQSTSCEMPGWMKHKLESRLLGEISITSDTQMTPHLWEKAKRN